METGREGEKGSRGRRVGGGRQADGQGLGRRRDFGGSAHSVQCFVVVVA